MRRPATALPRLLLSLGFAGGLLLSALSAQEIFTQVDVRPVPVKTKPPVYPASQKGSGVNGVVAVQLVISEKGTVEECTITKSSHPDFEAPAIEAVKQWVFKPAEKDGKKVKIRVSVPVTFAP